MTLQLFWAGLLASETLALIVYRLRSRERMYPLFFYYMIVDVILSLLMFGIYRVAGQSAYTQAQLIWGPFMQCALMLPCAEAIYRMHREVPYSLTEAVYGAVLPCVGALGLVWWIGHPPDWFATSRQAMLSFKAGASGLSGVVVFSFAMIHWADCRRSCRERCISTRHAMLLSAYLSIYAIAYWLVGRVPFGSVDLPMLIACTVCFIVWCFIW